MPSPVDRLTALFRPADMELIREKEFLRLIERATLRRGDAAWILPLGAGLLASGVLVFAGAMLIKLTSRPGVVVNWSRLGLVNVLLVVVVTAVVGGIVRWKLITSSIRRILNRVGCPACDFSLVGLKPEMGGVVCPECGERVLLSEHGLSEFDLLTESDRFKPALGAGKYGAYAGEGVGTVPAPEGKRRIKRVFGATQRFKPKPVEKRGDGDVIL